MEAQRYIDDRDYPEISFTGMADCYVLDTRIRFTLWDWVRLDGLFQRRLVGTLTRPLAGLMEDQQRSWDMAATAKAPSDEAVRRELALH